jgi:hypothetical protein
MSGLGLAGLGHLPAAEVYPVYLLNCRRGFGKPSQYGDRYAMILEPMQQDQPIRAATLTPGARHGCGPEALALTLSLSDFARVAKREGYRPEAVWMLADQALASGCPVSEYLWGFLEETRYDLAGYRRSLVRAIGYTSPHYIPHPIAIAGRPPAVAFLAPGPEGTGSDTVVPIRVQAGMTALLSLRQAWALKPNTSQLDYFTMCLLGEAHNLSLGDVMAGVEGEPALASLLRERIAAHLAHEPRRFRRLLSLTEERYDAAFQGGARRASFVREPT